MKKITALFITMVMIVAVITPGKVLAKNVPVVSLEKATTIAKQAFNLSTENYDFNYSYSEGQDGKNFWRLSWNAKKGSTGNIEVTVDSDTGDVIQMNRWEYNGTTPSRIPKYTKEQGLKTAQEFVQKMQPVNSKQMILVEDNNNYFSPYYYSPDTYVYKFQRKINGVDFPENGITITLDKSTLKMTSYTYQWDNGPFPEPSKAINIETAKKIFGDKLGIELTYRLLYDYENKKQNLILVYALKNGNYSIDAISGEIINRSYVGPMYDLDNAPLQSKGKNETVLTPEEQSSVDSNSKFITKEQAAEIVKKYIPQTANYKLNNANLFVDSITKKASWDLSWNKVSTDKDSSGYVNARVNALNSDLLSFYVNGNDFFPEPKAGQSSISKDMAKGIAEKFISDIQPVKFKTTEYREFGNWEYTEKYPASYYFTYMQKQNGAICPFNSFRVGVDAGSGKIMSYEMNWEDINLPSTSAAMPAQKAYDILYSKADFSLKYVKYYDYKNADAKGPEIRLAYVLDKFSGTMDSSTGAFLDYNGNPVKENKKVVYSDIKGHSSENDIILLSEMGVLEDQSGKYNPNNEMLQKDFIKMLVRAIEPYNYSYSKPGSNDDYENYYRIALDRKIISSKEKSPDSQVSKQMASKMLVRALGIGFVADLPDLYNLTFKDAKLIPNQYKGYAAIAYKVGVVNSENGNFNPSRHVLRGETATMIVNLLKVDVNIKE